MLILSEIFINFDVVPHNSIMHELNSVSFSSSAFISTLYLMRN